MVSRSVRFSARATVSREVPRRVVRPVGFDGTADREISPPCKQSSDSRDSTLAVSPAGRAPAKGRNCSPMACKRGGHGREAPTTIRPAMGRAARKMAETGRCAHYAPIFARCESVRHSLLLIHDTILSLAIYVLFSASKVIPLLLLTGVLNVAPCRFSPAQSSASSLEPGRRSRQRIFDGVTSR